MIKPIRFRPVRLIASGLLTVSTTLATTVSGSRVFAQTPRGVEIGVYSGRHYNTDKKLYEQFTARTGIKVKLLEGKDDALIERLRSEGRNSPADVLVLVDAARLDQPPISDSSGPAARLPSTAMCLPTCGTRRAAGMD